MRGVQVQMGPTGGVHRWGGTRPLTELDHECAPSHMPPRTLPPQQAAEKRLPTRPASLPVLLPAPLLVLLVVLLVVVLLVMRVVLPPAWQQRCVTCQQWHHLVVGRPLQTE